MTPSEMSKIIRAVLCRGLSFEQTEQILRAIVPVNADANTLIYREGERAQGLVVLLSGRVEVVKAGSEPLAMIDAPTVLGEISLLTEGTHTASVRAKTACEIALLTKTQFDRLLREENIGAFKVMQTLAEVLARRLQRMDEKFVELSKRVGPLAPVEELATFKQKLFSDWSV